MTSLQRALIIIVMCTSLAGGLWFGLGKRYRLAEPTSPRTIVIKSPSRIPQEVAEVKRRITRRLVKPDRSNVDCAVMKCIALTYDDGPSAHTNHLLDVLKSREAVATFFVLGLEAVKHPDVLKRIVSERNEIGNHTWSHPRMTLINDADMTVQLAQVDQIIRDATGITPRLIRPPYGDQGPRVVHISVRPLALWSIDPEDWKYRDPNSIYQHVINRAFPGGVVVLHDIYGPSAQATSSIVDELQRQGYVLVTMSELFGITDHNLPAFSHQVLRKR